jgi:UDP-arabinose 4-epimerase
MSKRKVFVTGGAGYVGSHSCKAFAQAGWDVIVYDNLSRGWADFVKWGPLIQGDILDKEGIVQALKKSKPDIVVHFAAMAYVGESMMNPATYYRTNTCGTLNVLDAMRTADIDAIVFSSTCATYGLPQRIPIDEHHPQVPINPYGWSKLFVERILADYQQAYGMRHVALRYFNAAGADPEGIIGERHVPETHVIPLAIRATIDGEVPFHIHGVDYPTNDGTCVRDYVHVSDLADAHVLAADYLLNGGTTEIFNLGTGTGVSVRQLASAIASISGRHTQQVLGHRRPGDPHTLVADASKARVFLDWKPKRSDIQTIISDAWSWHCSKPHKTQ